MLARSGSFWELLDLDVLLVLADFGEVIGRLHSQQSVGFDAERLSSKKTDRPVQFELMSEARKSLKAWLDRRGGTLRDFVFPSRSSGATWQKRALPATLPNGDVAR